MAAKGTIPSDIKILNRQMIIRAYEDGSTKTPNDISQAVGLSRQTVSKAIGYFLEEGILVPAGKGNSTEAGGRRPKNFELSRNILFAAINIEEKRIRFSLFNLYSEILHSFDEEIEEDPTYEKFEQVVKKGADILLENAEPNGWIHGISITLRGLVESDKKLLRSSPYYTKWEYNQSLEPILRFFPDATLLVLDKPVRTYARYFLDQNTEEFEDKRVLVLFSRKGMAGATIDHGHIEQGRNSIIGEFGHMIADYQSEKNISCLIKPDVIQQYLQDYIEDNPQSPLLTKKDIEYVDFMKEDIDPLRKRALDYLSRVFAVMIRNINLVFDADKILLIGEFSQFSEPFIHMIQEEISQFLYYPKSYMPDIETDTAALDDMLVKGSISHMIHMFYKNPNLYDGSGIKKE